MLHHYRSSALYFFPHHYQHDCTFFIILYQYTFFSISFILKNNLFVSNDNTEKPFHTDSIDNSKLINTNTISTSTYHIIVDNYFQYGTYFLELSSVYWAHQLRFPTKQGTVYTQEQLEYSTLNYDYIII